MTKRGFARGLAVLPSAICLVSVALAQVGWWKTYGGASDDEGYSVQQTADSGYIITGFTESSVATRRDVYLIRTNALGDTLWSRTYGGSNLEAGSSVRQTTDGGYVIAGYTNSFGAGFLDVYLIKTNASGDTLWTRTYGGTGTDWGYSVQQTVDGGYIIAGSSFTFGGAYLIKTNAQGDTLWTRIYSASNLNGDGGNSVQQTTDSGYIIEGTNYDLSATTDPSSIYLIKTNTSGDTLWTRTYGGTEDDWANCVEQTSDGGYIVAGYTKSFGAGNADVYLIKTSASGDTLWTRTYGGTGYDGGSSVQQTTDSGYIIAGVTTSFGAGAADLYLVKTNASGDTLWTRACGARLDEVGYSVRQTADDGYIIAGYTNSLGAGHADVYLVKTDANGTAVVEDRSNRSPANPARLLVQPNPLVSFARVLGHERELFSLADVTGRQVAVCKGDRVGEGLRPGIYFLSPVGLKAGRVVTETVIKIGGREQ